MGTYINKIIQVEVSTLDQIILEDSGNPLEKLQQGQRNECKTHKKHNNSDHDSCNDNRNENDKNVDNGNNENNNSNIAHQNDLGKNYDSFQTSKSTNNNINDNCTEKNAIKHRNYHYQDQVVNNDSNNNNNV